MRGPRATLLLLVVGVLVAQAAWILTMIPFGAIDEPDQAFRAAAVARGQWRADDPAPGGRGGLVEVPRDIVDAARAQCEALPYNKPVNCVGAGTTPDGLVRVGSAANRYHPAFYWLVGTAALPFHGAGALYAMRIATALLCAAGLAAAAWCLLRRDGDRWVRAGLVVAASPVLVYATTVPAPNGPEMAAGLMLWAGLLGLRAERRPGDGWLVAWASVGTVLLVTLRSLGPIFAVLILGCVLLARRHEVVPIVRAHLRALVAGLVVCLVAGVGSLAWTLSAKPLGQHDGDPSSVAFSKIFQIVPIGLLQTIAAAPRRDEPAPIIVYPLYLLLIVVLLVAGLRRRPGAGRASLVLAVVLTQVLPLAVTALGLRTVGLVWQGRYALPFTAGVLLLAAVRAGRTGVRLPRFGWVLLAGCYVVAQVLACVGTFVYERQTDKAPTPGWLETSPLTIAAVATIGFGLLAWSVLRTGTDSAVDGPAGGAAAEDVADQTSREPAISAQGAR